MSGTLVCEDSSWTDMNQDRAPKSECSLKCGNCIAVQELHISDQ